MKQLLERLREWMPRPPRIIAPFRYAGGKGRLARHLVRMFPRGDFRVYVEPFCGAASVFWHNPRPFPVEILNDIDGHIIALFRALQDRDRFERLAHRLLFTPYSRAEFERAWDIIFGETEAEDDVEIAWAIFVVQNMGWGGKPILRRSDWAYSYRSAAGMSEQASEWLVHIKSLEYYHRRLMRVQLECDDALRVIRRHDTTKTFFYLDPPYVPTTRNMSLAYRCDQDTDFHERLVDLLLETKGAVMLSGYPNEIYRRLEEAGWQTFDFKTTINAAVRGRGSGMQGSGALIQNEKHHRIERVWINYRLPEQLTMFDSHALGDYKNA